VSKLATLRDLDVPGWTGRVGALGKHATITRSIWFNPVPWVIAAAVFTWLVLMARQVPCIPMAAHPYTRLCYSDIPVLYWSKYTFWSGGPLFNEYASSPSTQLEYPVLIAGLIWITRWLGTLFGSVALPGITDDQKVAAASNFWAINAALLFVCFCLLVWAHLQMGRDSASQYTGGVRTRAWDALFIAGAPVVMLSGLINWDMLAVALTSLGLLTWARGHPLLAGILVGLAAATKFYPLALVAVFFVLCLRAGKIRVWAAFTATAGLAWLVVNLPVMLTTPKAWAFFWTYNTGRGGDFGSFWYVLTLMGIPLSSNVATVLMVILIALAGGAIVGLVLSAPRRPRVAQVALLVMVAFLVLNKVYSPQYVLWLLPFVVLARPVFFDIIVFTVSESLYYFAIWGFLGGALAQGTGPDRLYWLAVLLRIGVQLWIAYRVIDDIRHPWYDPVRGPFIDDPIGGILNHAPDAAWLQPRGLAS